MILISLNIQVWIFGAFKDLCKARLVTCVRMGVIFHPEQHYEDSSSRCHDPSSQLGPCCLSADPKSDSYHSTVMSNLRIAQVTHDATVEMSQLWFPLRMADATS